MGCVSSKRQAEVVDAHQRVSLRRSVGSCALAHGGPAPGSPHARITERWYLERPRTVGRPLPRASRVTLAPCRTRSCAGAGRGLLQPRSLRTFEDDAAASAVAGLANSRNPRRAGRWMLSRRGGNDPRAVFSAGGCWPGRGSAGQECGLALPGLAQPRHGHPPPIRGPRPPQGPPRCVATLAASVDATDAAGPGPACTPDVHAARRGPARGAWPRPSRGGGRPSARPRATRR